MIAETLHIAIAEEYSIELYTYHSRDFGRIQSLYDFDDKSITELLF
jgi:hypothetical protein